jgi:phosphoenolpyruvate carboxykinase (GTP)
LTEISVSIWKNEIESIREHYARFGDKLPPELADQLSALKKRLGSFN